MPGELADQQVGDERDVDAAVLEHALPGRRREDGPAGLLRLGLGIDNLDRRIFAAQDQVPGVGGGELVADPPADGLALVLRQAFGLGRQDRDGDDRGAGRACSPLPVAAPSRFFRRPGLPPLRVFFFPSSPLRPPAPAPPLSSPASPPPRLFSELRPKAARSYLAIRCLRTSISAACSAIVRSSAAARSAGACCDRISSISRSRDSPRSSAAAAGPAPSPRPP